MLTLAIGILWCHGRIASMFRCPQSGDSQLCAASATNCCPPFLAKQPTTHSELRTLMETHTVTLRHPRRVRIVVLGVLKGGRASAETLLRHTPRTE